MADRTKSERSEAAEKAAATRKENEAKQSDNELRKAADEALDAAKDLGKAVGKTASEAAKAARRRANS